MSFRIPEPALRLIDDAAGKEHKNRTAFIVDAAVAHAQEVLRDQVVFTIGAEAFDALCQRLDNPPPPTDTLRAFLHEKPAWERAED